MRVLLPIDNSEERAIAAAETVLSLPNAAESVHVTLLNVQKEINVAGDDGGHVSSDDWYDEDEFPSSVEKAKEVLENAGVTVEKRREHAEPPDAIIKFAEEMNADRIIMAGRKRTPVGKVLFGSVTQSVLLHSDVPVTVIAM
jgi:nucleotide-binding universal stress UspA family protein